METKLKVLMVGSDRKLFEEGSAVSERIKEYGKLVDELHIIVFAKKSLGLKDRQISSNVWVYPTDSISRWFYVSDGARLGKKIVSEKNFVRGGSVITAQDPFECGLAALRVKKKWRLPLEVQLHTNPFSKYFSGVLNFLRKIIAKRVLRNADGVRVVSEQLKQQVSSYNLKAQISVLPIFVDKEKTLSEEPAQDLRSRFGWNFILVSVARLSPEKDHSTALYALAEVRKKLPGAGMIFVGSGSEEGKLKSLAKRLRVLDHVHFAGWQKDPVSYMKGSSALIQTSRFEGYGMAVVEAGLSGLPVITTPVGIAQEMEDGREALICPVGDSKAFAEAVLRLSGDNQLRELLKANMAGFIKDKLPSKEGYLLRIKEVWEQVSRRVS